MVLKFLKSSYHKVKSILSKTGSLIGTKIKNLFKGKVDENTLDQLEQIFYEADLGVKNSTQLTDKVRDLLKKNPELSTEQILDTIKAELLKLFPENVSAIKLAAKAPTVILIVGVNGNGKTTSTAKLARLFQKENKTVLVGAADTFRAAAAEQLEIWAERLGIDIVKGMPKSDPAAVVFDTISAATAREKEIVLIDTAGRLHTKTPLMQELQKILRTCRKFSAENPQEVLLVLDATTGQNGIDQAKTFHQFVPLTGIILTKLDGNAKGGIILSIQRELGIPVKFIGIGESIEDLEAFEPESFIKSLLE